MGNIGGILLAGGLGTRLIPNTTSINKHFLPVYDKPMIYYSLSLLFLSGIREVTIVCNESDLNSFEKLLENGEQFGAKIKYSIQDNPNGIPDAINTALAENSFSRNLVVLGDNFIYGREFFNDFKKNIIQTDKIALFSQYVKDPSEFGVINYKSNGEIKDIIEKPVKLISNEVVIGMYLFDKNFSTHFSNINLSARGEFEITDLIKDYGLSNLAVKKIGRGTAWFDMGSFDSFYNCSSFVKTIQDRLGLLVCSPHEIAFNNGWISKYSLEKYIKHYSNSEYFEKLSYLLK